MRQSNQPRINFMSDVSGFLTAWDDRHNPDHAEHVEIYQTVYGNLNNSGQVGNYDGHALSPWHAQFLQAIEPGVRDMVLFFVQQKKWITYTSCEGHRYRAQTHLHPVERHVGLLPRNDTEYQCIHQFVDAVVQQYNAQHLTYPITLSMVELTLSSEQSTHKAIDVFFVKQRFAPWSWYFGVLPRVYTQFMDFMQQHTELHATS